MDYNQEAMEQDETEAGLVYQVNSLLRYFRQVSDTRKAKGKRYSLETLLVVMMLAKLSGEDKPSGIAEWGAHRAETLVEMKVLEKKQAPSHMTYRRILEKIIQPEEFERLVSEFQQGHYEVVQGVVFSMDGKAVRGTILPGETRGTHLLSIFVPKLGLVLAETAVDRKENEISVAPTLLKQVDLHGAIVIGDAMHAQRETSTQIVESGGEFIWTIKGNQARTEWAIEKLFVHEICNLKQGAPLSKHCQMVSKVSKGHGRLEKRTILVSAELNDYLDWPFVAQVFRLEREVWHSRYQGRTCQVVYGLTSLTANEAPAHKLLALTRNYWGIENGLHYRRDVTLHEDATRLSIGNSGHNIAILNNLVISLCCQAGFKNLPKARRLFNAKPEQALQLITSNKIPFL